MKNIITIKPVTRIEGHASVYIFLDDNGNFHDAKVSISSFRGFEKFIVGKPAEEIPRIVTRICGVCPWMHHIASVMAVDRCFGVDPPITGKLLRELMITIAHLDDKLLHFFFLAGADFILNGDVDKSRRNMFGIIKEKPDLAKKILEIRGLLRKILQEFSGKAVHPITGVVGGFSKAMNGEERVEIKKIMEKSLEFCLYIIDFTQKNIFPKFMEKIELGLINTGFMSLVSRDGYMDFMGERIRLMDADGEYMEFLPENYSEFIEEEILPFSYGKLTHTKSLNGDFSLNSDDYRGIYRVNSLARVNTCEKISTPLAESILMEFRKSFGRPVQNTIFFHYARLIEAVFACERAIQILGHPEILNTKTRNPCSPCSGRGVGCIEAPRGTLFHDYSTDEKGCILNANIIVGTNQNLGAINLSVKQVAKNHIKDGKISEEILNNIEMAIRAYDP